MPIQKFPADATAVSAPKNRQIASYRQEKPVADIRSPQADMRPFSRQLGTAAGSYDNTPVTFNTLLGRPGLNVGAIATQGPGYEFITAGDSTALMPVHRQERPTVEKSKPAVELRAGRGGPSNYRSAAQAQKDYDDLIADEYTRKERARQREILYDLASRTASAAPWLEDLEDATGRDAPYLVDKVAEFAGPGDAFNIGRHALTAMPWFFTSKQALESGAVRSARKAFQRQSVLDGAGDPTGMQMRRYVDDDLELEPRYGIQDEGYVLPDEDAVTLFKTPRERQDHYARLELKARAADKKRDDQILAWALGPDLGQATPELRPYVSPEKMAAAAREEAIKAAAAKRKEAMDQEILYDELDYAGRHGYLDGEGNFVPMPSSEVLRSYVDRPTRRILYRGNTPESEEAAKAMHLYDQYYPVEDLLNPRPPLKRTPEELDAYLDGLVEDIEP